MRKKHFDYKGQMINYFNKLIKDARVADAYYYTDATKGYTVEWLYK